MYVIIFSIDKNYELYQELEEGGEMVVYVLKILHSIKSPRNSAGQAPNPLKKGESPELNSKQILVTQKSSFIINGWRTLRCNSPFKKGARGIYSYFFSQNHR